MSRFGDNATGPSNLEISNISGVSSQINTLAGYTTELSNLGAVSAEIQLLGTAAVVEDLGFLGTQAVVDDMDVLANVTSELGLLGTTAMTGYIQAIGTSTVAGSSPTQLTVDALGQLTSEISLLASNIQTLQNSASNSPIQLDNLSDVDFGGNTPSAGDTIVYVAGSTNKFELQPLPGAGPLSGTNLTENNPQPNQILKITAVNAGVPEYENATVSDLVYSADFDNIAEVAAATPSAAGEVVHYDGISAWTVGRLEYSEIDSKPTALSDFNVTNPTTTGYGLQWNGTSYVEANFAELGSDIVSPTSSGGFLRANAGGSQFEMSVPVPNLTSTDDYAVLAASQGKALKDLIDGLGDIIVVADNTARANLTGLDVGDIIHTTSDANHGNNWTRYQITSVAGGTTFATATSVLVAKASDFSNANLVSIIDDAPIGTATDSSIGTITIRPNGGNATKLQFQCENASFTNHLVTIEGPQHAGGFNGYTLKLPDAAPAAGQMLVASSTYATDSKLEFVDAGATVGVAAAMAIVF